MAVPIPYTDPATAFTYADNEPGFCGKEKSNGGHFNATVILVGLIGLPVVLFPQLILTLMFSSSFTPVAGLVYLFVIGQIINQLAGVHQAFLIGVDDFKTNTIMVTCGQLFFAALAWTLAPRYESWASHDE